MSVTIIKGQSCGETGHRDAMLDSSTDCSSPGLLNKEIKQVNKHNRSEKTGWCINNEYIQYIVSFLSQCNVRGNNQTFNYLLNSSWLHQLVVPFAPFFEKEEIVCFLCLCQCGYCRLDTSSYLTVLHSITEESVQQQVLQLSIPVERLFDFTQEDTGGFGGERAVLANGDDSDRENILHIRSQGISLDSCRMY